jgi:hypothetical protein
MTHTVLHKSHKSHKSHNIESDWTIHISDILSGDFRFELFFFFINLGSRAYTVRGRGMLCAVA